ncbi:MAG TPA: DUF4836 family protein [Flavipsychrobacter sp.]|nr:DUF4836 family protein [Flavipsychrobacter sp.]
MNLRFLLFLFVATVVFSACNSLPDHAKYIPKDAVVVVGLNTKKIGKQIAWSALIGSKLFNEMKTSLPPKHALEGLGDAGIEHMSTSYLYVKNYRDADAGTRITALVPLDDAGKWEVYVKRTFPNTTIKEADGRKEANLVDGMYVGWTKDLLIVMNIIENQVSIKKSLDTSFADSSLLASKDSFIAEGSPTTFAANEQLLSSEMKNAFTIQKNNAITDDARFKKMETDGHDITVWMNYDILMSENSDKMGMPSQLALGSTLWKQAAFSGGFDFEKGKITGDMLYYTSEELRNVAEEFGSKNADKELLERLPAQNLNMLMAFHLSTKGLKGLLEKIGVLGFANLALSSEGISTDDIFEAFTGDLGVAVNDFTMNYSSHRDSSKDSSTINYSSQNTTMNFLYTMKIGNKEKFNKLMTYLQQKQLLTPIENNLFTSSFSDSMFLTFDNNYIAVSNKSDYARAYLAGKFKAEPTPAVIKNDVYNHPIGMYLSFQTILASIKPHQNSGITDSVALQESRNLLDNLVFNGGEYSKNAFSYKFALNLVNKKENAIFQLMNFAMKMNEAAENEKASKGKNAVHAGAFEQNQYH